MRCPAGDGEGYIGLTGRSASGPRTQAAKQTRLRPIVHIIFIVRSSLRFIPGFETNTLGPSREGTIT